MSYHPPKYHKEHKRRQEKAIRNDKYNTKLYRMMENRKADLRNQNQKE